MRRTIIGAAFGAATLLAFSAAAQNFAITKQISPINPPADKAIVELGTLSRLPVEVEFASLTTPQGIKFEGVNVRNCETVTKAGENCRQYFTFALDAVSSGKCTLSGDYLAKFNVKCRAGMPAGDCKPGPRDVPFKLTSENFCVYTTVDASKMWQQAAKGQFAQDVGLGGTTLMWFLSSAEKVAGGYMVVSLDLNSTAGMRRNGGAVRIDAGGDGMPWVVNGANEIFRFSGGQWQRMPGAAVDVGVGANGTVWVLGTNKVPGGYGLHRWDGKAWQPLDGGAVRIDVDAGGNPWVVNDQGEVFRRVGNGWAGITMGVKARDIGIGANGAVFIVGADGNAYKLAADGKSWQNRGGGDFTDITVGPKGEPVALKSSREIWIGQP